MKSVFLWNLNINISLWFSSSQISSKNLIFWVNLVRMHECFSCKCIGNIVPLLNWFPYPSFSVPFLNWHLFNAVLCVCVCVCLKNIVPLLNWFPYPSFSHWKWLTLVWCSLLFDVLQWTSLCPTILDCEGSFFLIFTFLQTPHRDHCRMCNYMISVISDHWPSKLSVSCLKWDRVIQQDSYFVSITSAWKDEDVLEISQINL